MDEMTTNMMVCGFFAIALIMATERCIIAYKEAACNMSIGIMERRRSTMFLGIAWYIVGTLLISAIGASQTELGNCMATLVRTVSILTFCVAFLIEMGPEISVISYIYIAMFVIVGQLIARLGQIMMLQKNLFSADTDIQYLGKYAEFLIDIAKQLPEEDDYYDDLPDRYRVINCLKSVYPKVSEETQKKIDELGVIEAPKQ